MLAASSTVWVQTIVSVVIVSLIAFVGIVILIVREGLLQRVVPILVSFAVGALLGDALFHILPELAEDGGITVAISWVMAGAIITLLLEDTIGGVVRPMLALSAGGFIYIAGSDLIPELHKSTELRISIVQFLGIAAGFGVMAALLSLE